MNSFTRKYLTLLMLVISTSIYCQIKKISKEQIADLTVQSRDFYIQGKFEKSLITVRKAVYHAVNQKEHELSARCYLLMSFNFKALEHTDKAIEFSEKALEFASLTQNQTIKVTIYNELGYLYANQKQNFKAAEEYLLKGLDIGLKKQDTSLLVYSKLQLTTLYFDQKQFDKGNLHLNFINKNFEKFSGTRGLLLLYTLNGMFLSSKNFNINANKYFEKASQIQAQEEFIDDRPYFYKEYSKYLYKIKQFQKAYDYQALHEQTNQKYLANNKLEKSKVSAINVEMDEYKRQIVQIQKDKSVKEKFAEKSNLIIWLFAGLLLAMVMFLLSLSRFYASKIETNNILINQNLLLSKANANALESSRLKSQFVSTISHELRTPLYGIIGLTNILKDNQNADTREDDFKSLEFSANYLLSLVNNILLASKIEEKEIKIDNSYFKFADNLKSIKNSLLVITSSNNNNFLLNIDEQIPDMLIGDKIKLDQILINLLSNALKFTKNGTVELNVKLLEKNETRYNLEFKVKDNGLGIAEEDQHKIFDDFVQVGDKNQEFQGTGLGLKIVKKLLELFDSQLILTSKLGVGTTFSFQMWFELNTIDDSESNAVKVIQNNKKLKILVVEDNKINQIVTKKIIEKNNSTCLIVDNGQSAIDILKIEKFDIILMDINMHGLNGYQTTKIIRQNNITTPIIALTAYSKAEVLELAQQSGLNDVLVKPFQESDLFEIIYSQIL